MKKYNGKSIYRGVAVGSIKYYRKVEIDTARREITAAEAEVKRYEDARDAAIRQLNEVYEKAKHEVDKDTAEIFEVQAMMLSDDDYNDSIWKMIREHHDNAEYAVQTTGDTFAKTFSDMDDDYMKARSFDIKDISRRILCILSGQEPESLTSATPFILAADDLTPAETVQLDKSKVLAFVTKYGSSNSHTAILARTMNIPAVTGVIVNPEWNGKQAAVDGFTGEVIIEPDEETLAVLKKKRAEEEERRERLMELKGKDDVTKSGRHISLYANIGSVNDVEAVLENDAAGIGLFRSEFLYIGRDTYPTEEEQFVAYKNVARKMKGKKVVIRTLDIGADKKADYFKLDHEENPAMGFRAIRICLERPELFKTQLRAIYRASAFGTVSIMYPMITSLQEVRRIKEISAEVRSELSKENISYGNVEEGIMIETPAAVMISEDLAAEVDFFSIGTNDLTQYTLAIDRQNAKLDRFYDQHHPAVLKMIKMTVESGHKHDCWVGICGELGADTTLTETFIGMGIDELSVSPASVLTVREKIRETA
ncbi:MAG TPA: phosphoenolpyruvate--protein phosphotransferase [Treponema sp.]|nr:phosphoenolpyruvate--protein phosphotransferase [Treponema sp.]